MRPVIRRTVLSVTPLTAIAAVGLAAAATTATTASADGACVTAGATTTCTYTTVGEASLQIPDGVTTVQVTAVGGAGGGDPFDSAGGPGAVVTGEVAVPSNGTLYIEVGGNASVFEGGSNGGANSPNNRSGPGGGASDVRTLPNTDPNTLSSRLLVAAGGGGGGVGLGAGCSTAGGSGGAGGEPGMDAAETSAADPDIGGKGGTSGGSGGAGGTSATFGASNGGQGGAGSPGQGGSAGLGATGDPCAGGAGGGGLIGGGGGGGGGFDGSSPSGQGGGGGGGGGSNLVPPGGTSGVDTTGIPEVVITYTANPASQLAGLLQAVQKVGPGHSLADKVTQAQAYLASGDVTDTCSTLGTFTGEVNAQTGMSIPTVTAAQLITLTQGIQTVLGC